MSRVRLRGGDAGTVVDRHVRTARRLTLVTVTARPVSNSSTLDGSGVGAAVMRIAAVVCPNETPSGRNSPAEVTDGVYANGSCADCSRKPSSAGGNVNS